MPTPVAIGADDDVFRQWKLLSARSQNLHHQLTMLGRDTAPDPSMHEEALKGIDDALNQLVAVGELESKQVRLKPPADGNDEAYQELFGAVERLSDEYGFFVASEMCDLGARLRFVTIKPNEFFELHLRLPPKEVKAFIAHAAALELLETSKAEQGGAGEPATRSASDSEGGDKPQPKSEGRSR